MSCFFRIVKEAGKNGWFHIIAFIVNPEIIDRNICNIYNYWFKAVKFYAMLVVLSEDERLACFHEKCFFFFRSFLGEHFKCSVIEHVAVLIYLYKRSSDMLVRFFQNAAQMNRIPVHASCNESCSCTQRERQRVERMID